MNHWQRVLLVEDDEGNKREIERWLKKKHYIEVARSLEEAMKYLLDNHYHVVIVDINLDHEHALNKDGFRLLKWIANQPSLEGLPCIVITAYDRGDLAIEGFNGKLPIEGWVVKRLSYRDELLDTVSGTFDKTVCINFALEYEADSLERLPHMARHIQWPEGTEKPNEPMLIEEIRDLIGKHFNDASCVYLQELTKGLSGAAVIRVKAKWDSDFGPANVLKISRRDKVEKEFDNYKKYVAHHLPPNTAVNAQVMYAGHLGAIQFNFAEDANNPLPEFDTFFQQRPAAEVALALHSLFRDTCRYWYDSPKPGHEDLIDLYYKALNLDEEKLVTRIHQLLSGFDKDEPRLSLPDEPTDLINPLYWLKSKGKGCIVKIYKSISHGDLTGRNVFVNEQGHCWLIDFYRTERSHILRDFVILETDIKYRLLPELFQKAGRPQAYSWEEYWAMEQALCSGEVSHIQGCSPEVQKATEALLTLRSLANEFMANRHRDGSNIRRQILISRLITHLNVTRLRHVEPRYKLWALGTAGHICEELDQLPPPR